MALLNVFIASLKLLCVLVQLNKIGSCIFPGYSSVSEPHLLKTPIFHLPKPYMAVNFNSLLNSLRLQQLLPFLPPSSTTLPSSLQRLLFITNLPLPPLLLLFLPLYSQHHKFWFAGSPKQLHSPPSMMDLIQCSIDLPPTSLYKLELELIQFPSSASSQCLPPLDPCLLNRLVEDDLQHHLSSKQDHHPFHPPLKQSVSLSFPPLPPVIPLVLFILQTDSASKPSASRLGGGLPVASSMFLNVVVYFLSSLHSAIKRFVIYANKTYLPCLYKVCPTYLKYSLQPTFIRVVTLNLVTP